MGEWKMTMVSKKNELSALIVQNPYDNEETY